MTNSGFRRDSSGFEPTEFIPRPASNHDAFRDLDADELTEAQSHWDAANTARLARIEREKKMAEYDASEEGQAARRAHTAMYRG